KDAASSSIYGSRGAGGVVIVTTKRGTKGKELKVELNTTVGFSEIERYVSTLTPAEHLLFIADARDDAYLQDGGDLSVLPMERPWDRRYNQDWVNTARTNPSAIPVYNPVGVLMRTGMDQNYQLTLSGATAGARYMVSGNYFRQEGIVRNTDYTRYALRANVDVDVTTYLTVGMNLAPAYVVSNDRDTEGKQYAINDAEVTAGFIDPRLGYWGESDPFIDFPVHLQGPVSLARIEQLKDEKNRAQILADLYAQLNFGKGLTFKSSFGAVYISERRDRFNNQIIARTGKPSGENWDNQYINVLNENILNFDRTFASVHHINAMAGFTVQSQTNKGAYIYGSNFANDLVPTLNAAGSWTANTTQSENALLSYLGRLQYAFADKYLLSASIRTDGSSRFGANTKWGTFPSVSAGWRLDQESFIQSVDAISRLKLRASWGKTGNNDIGDYASIPTLQNATYQYGASETLVIGMRPANIANKDLSWEKTATADVGLDIGVLDNRISLSVDYYNSHTSGLLLNVPIPYITGFSTELQNIGEVENKGVEIELSTTNIHTANFNWTTDLNFSFNQNKVLKLGANNTPIITGDWYDQVCITMIGKPIGSYYVYKNTGVYMNQAEVDADPARRANTRPGDMKVEDYNKDGQITPDDRQVFGSNIPKYYFGFTNRASWKNFDLSVFLNGVGGNEIFNSNGRGPNRQGGSSYVHYSHWKNRWRSPEEPGNGRVPRASDRLTGIGGEFTSFDIYDGSYVRLKNITVGYTLPAQLLKPLQLSSLRVYASMDNVYLWDHYHVGYTPEVDMDGGVATRAGRDYGTYPSTRSILFGLNITF
ncbi:MAG: SusC/RagA family TonB-linked outer membrane protein, partial [Tannerella sp.]|nr:SusC/RagA family TonB-linked outer membrane protein [Tannerella sp.]